MAELAVETVRLKAREPLVAAWGVVGERELLRVRLDFGGGDFGEGEAAPLEPYDGVSLASVRAALDAYTEVLARASPRSTHAELLAACAAERSLPQALAAVDLALWDRAGRRTGFPVAQLIAAGAMPSVAVNATIGVGDDAARVAAVRAAVPDDMAVRIDANGAWSTPDEAIANLRALASAGIELCEEPVHGLDKMRAVRAKSPVPVAMDETGSERGAPGAGAADAICLKISRCGGISGVLRDARAARAAGTKVYVASNWDGPLGIAAGVHAAAGLRASGPVAYCGLASLAAYVGYEDVLAAHDGTIQVPAGPGLLG